MPYHNLVKLPSLTFAVCVLAACSNTSKTSQISEEQAAPPTRSVEYNHQLSNVADGKSNKRRAASSDLSQRDELKVEQDKFKFAINGEIFFSNMTELLPGAKVVDNALIGWKVTPRLTISFEQPRALNKSWTVWLNKLNASYETRDNIHYQIKLKSANNLDMYKVYQQAKSMSGVKQVELGLTALPRRDRGAQEY